MKKRILKLCLLNLSAAMILATGVTAFAANNEITDARTFTISAKQGDKHTYEVYQILKGILLEQQQTEATPETNCPILKQDRMQKGSIARQQ